MINQHCVNMWGAYSSVVEPQLSKACMKSHPCLCLLKRSERGSVCAREPFILYFWLSNEIVRVWGCWVGDELGLNWLEGPVLRVADVPYPMASYNTDKVPLNCAASHCSWYTDFIKGEGHTISSQGVLIWKKNPNIFSIYLHHAGINFCWSWQ